MGILERMFSKQSPPEPPNTDLSQDVIAGSLENLVDDFFSDVLGPESPGQTESAAVEPGTTELKPQAAAETRKMFENIAAVYVRPLRQFLARVKAGPVSIEWIEICLPAVGMVGRSASQMGFASLATVLDDFGALLNGVKAGEARIIAGSNRDAILEASALLAEELPLAFTLDGELEQTDSIIVHSLLRQVPDVGAVTLDKIFGAGLTSVEMLECANSEDLARTTGISMLLSDRIYGAVQDHGRQSRALHAVESPVEWHAWLAPVFEELKGHHEAFQRPVASGGRRNDEDQNRRYHRRQRQNAALKANVLLAEMGKVKLVDEVQRLSFDSRIRRLHQFIASLDGAPQA